MKKLFFLLSFFCLSAFEEANYTHHLKIQNQKKQEHHFIVSIADTPNKRAQGLMFVDDLPQNYGMLFEFDSEQVVNMWMKNTKIPLDMIFIDKNNKIAHIKQNAAPESLKIISSEKLVKKVLEINGGKVEELGINVGDKIIIN